MLQAKRRYKVLLREQDRLHERGQKDPEVDRQLDEILTQFPELRETKAAVSDGTKALLAFGEQMSTADDVARAPADPASLSAVALATESGNAKNASDPLNAAQQQQTGQETRVAQPTHAVGGGNKTCDAEHHRGSEEAYRATRRKQDYPSEANLTRALNAAALLLRVAGGLRARPSTSPAALFLLVAGAIIAAAAHVVVIHDLCSYAAFFTSPTALVFALHAYLWRLRSRRSARRSKSADDSNAASKGPTIVARVEAAAIYGVRDVIPTLVVAWVVYLFWMIVSARLTGSTPKRFCNG